MKTIRFSNFIRSVKISADDSAAEDISNGRPVGECLPSEQVELIERTFSTRFRPCNWNDLVAWEDGTRRILSNSLKVCR